jgi:hypothetical protein
MQVLPFNGAGGAQQHQGFSDGQILEAAQSPSMMVARAMSSPESLPTFPALAAGVDSFMSRLPWWAVAAGAAGAMWWWMKGRKGGGAASSG